MFNYLRNFRHWPEWSPWLITDPDCKLSFAEDGTSYSWEGPVAGSGKIEVTDEQSPDRIDYRLTFLKPFRSTADVSFHFATKDESTQIDWTMDSSLPFFLFFLKDLMNAVIAMDYQRGLKMLKDRHELGSVPSKLEFPGVQSFAEVHFAGVRKVCAIAEIGPSMQESFGKLGEWICDKELQPSGPWISIYHKWEMAKGMTEYTAAVPFETLPDPLPEGFVSGSIPACRTFPIRHIGAYRHLGNAWSAGIMRSQNKVIHQTKSIPPFECYETQPDEVPEEKAVTVVHFPLKD